MQPIQVLGQTLETLASPEHALFTAEDFLSLFPNFTAENLRVLLSRAVQKGILERVCKGIYLNTKTAYDFSLVLYKAAAIKRSRWCNYVSLETVLSESSVISQQLMGWITIMTTGRSGIIHCSRFGSIEFVHTQKKIESVMDQLSLDPVTGLLKASIKLALQDMKDTRRSMDLITEIQNESV